MDALNWAPVLLTFSPPAPETLALFGDKTLARERARSCGVPVLRGSAGPVSLNEAQAFLASLPDGESVVIKAVAGGGGRGMRVVRSPDELPQAFERCQSEARASFGRADVYVERRVVRARHVEVQVAGDGSGAVVALGERECSIQRRHQKLIEIAPAPGLPDGLRERLSAAALRIAESARYAGLGTFEFLVDAAGEFAFLEANPRLQVEHTVTEEVTGVDLVVLQLELAAGRTLAELDLTADRLPAPRGSAIQLRVSGATVYMQDLKVVYDRGSPDSIPVRAQIRAGGETKPLDLRGDRRHIKLIELSYGSKPTLRGQPVVCVFGRP